MIDISMNDVLGLIGQELDDNTETKDKFREFLSRSKWQPEHFESWLKECADKGSRSERVWYNAMQDIAVAVGERLGFGVEFGRYSGSASEIAYDGLWRSPSGAAVLVEVKSSAWPVSSVGQLGEYVKRFTQATEEEAYGLYVIGSSNFQPLIDQIKGGEYRSLLRLIGFDDLINLWRVKVDLDEMAGQRIAAERIESIILPMESVDVGNLVRLVLEMAELRTVAATEESPETVTEDMTGEDTETWEREELLEFFDENTDWQNALLAALALTDEEQVFSDRLQKLVRRVGQEYISGLEDKSLGSLAGPRAGFKMRRGNKEDFIGSEWDRSREKHQNVYWLRPPYDEWILQWVRDKGWDMPTATTSTD